MSARAKKRKNKAGYTAVRCVPWRDRHICTRPVLRRPPLSLPSLPFIPSLHCPLQSPTPESLESQKRAFLRIRKKMGYGRTDGLKDQRTDGPTNKWTDRRTHRRTDRPSYRDARTLSIHWENRWVLTEKTADCWEREAPNVDRENFRVMIQNSWAKSCFAGLIWFETLNWNNF